MGIQDGSGEGATGSPRLAEKVHQIRTIIKELSLYDSLEVLANVLIFEGAAFMGLAQDKVNPLTVFAHVSEDMSKQGPTLANSTAMLGIDLLGSLNKLE